METKKTRMVWMDMAKALGMLIVLLVHAELSLGPVTYLGGMFYMPVFFVLAGMTFHMREGESFAAFLKKKAERLLLPYFAYNLFLILFFLIKDSLLTGTISEQSFFPFLGMLYSRNQLYQTGAAANVYFMPNLNAPTWFLTGLFAALVIYYWICRWSRGDQRKKGMLTGACVLAAVLWHWCTELLLPWSLDCALYAVAFLYVGELFREKRAVERMEKRYGILALGALVFAALSYWNGSVNMSIGAYGKSMLVYLIIGGLGSFLCLELCKWLEKSCMWLRSAGGAAGQVTLRMLGLHLFVFMVIKTAAGFTGFWEPDSVSLKIWMIFLTFLLFTPGKWKDKLTVLLTGTILLWAWPFLNKGLDVQDTGSYLTKFHYIFQRDVQVNELFYLLGEVMGGIIYHLAPGAQVLVLSAASFLLYTLTGFLLYVLLKPYLQKQLLLLAVLTGSLYAVTWIHCLNWNTWTVLLLTAGILVVRKGLLEEKKKWLFAGGFLLGINTFFRMPNILFLALVVAVMWYAFGHAGGKGKTAVWAAVRWAVPFTAGGAAAGVTGLLLGVAFLGVSKTLSDILTLTSVGATGETTHSITTGIYLFFVGMKQGAILWLVYGALLVLLAVCAAFLGRLAEQFLHLEHGGRLCAGTACVLAALYGLYRGLTGEILYAHTMTAFGTIFFCVIGAFYYRKKDLFFSTLCVMTVIVEGFLTIGTDTGTNFYRIYMTLPLAMVVILFLRWSGKKRCACVIPAFLMAFVLGAGYQYATTHIYHDGERERLVCEIDSRAYAGVKTTKERAAYLTRLQELLAPYKEQEILTMGAFNVSEIVEMKPFLNSSWNDLEYLSLDNMKLQIREKTEQGIYPVVVIATEEINGPYWMPQKVEYLEGWMEEENYQLLYADAWYAVYVPGNA